MNNKMKSITLIMGHPDEESFCRGIADSYLDGASRQDVKINLIDLSQLQFNPNLQHGYRKRTDLEPDLLRAQQMIKDADHLVFVYPIWWGSVPAILKGFFDRILLPGFAYDPKPGSVMWDKRLKGKTAHLIVTMDTPPWYYRFFYGSSGHRVMKQGVLGYCGIKTVKVTEISPIKTSTDRQRQEWLQKIKKLGAQLA
ncbi:NAD(P)H-dependent oxidoreductase [Paenibacillus sp. Marseille-Q4541]|uniref:NAD(P)H-dependent oxidoreductase n=1 Tax=Paenibacillus sp. Marseille-Q4541 TaxID=2831522 RepID=UPI002019BE03|nr:NAD(P)H-dependent oxidoreductase [Paenibacillus sp. Marseille-Q4541]